MRWDKRHQGPLAVAPRLMDLMYALRWDKRHQVVFEVTTGCGDFKTFCRPGGAPPEDATRPRPAQPSHHGPFERARCRWASSVPSPRGWVGGGVRPRLQSAPFLKRVVMPGRAKPAAGGRALLKSARSALCSLKAREARFVPSPLALRASDLQKQMRTETSMHKQV